MKVLIVATHVWPLAAHISIGLTQVGFEVATVSPPRSLVRTIRRVTTHYTYVSWKGLSSIAAAIRVWQPDLLVCTDDQAVNHLHDLHAATSKSPDKDGCRLVNLIERSLGNPSSFPTAAQKSMFITTALKAGVSCPKTWVIPADKDISKIPHVPYPTLVKADGTFGGRGVRVVGNENQARTAISELTLPAILPDRIKKPLAKTMSECGLKPKRKRTVCLQEQVIGRPANRAVVCHQGNVLAGVSVEALETQHELGPASIIRRIEHAGMAAAAATMVERLQLSGFIGFDFILDEKNAAWLIEMNPRVTPICHLRFADGTSLPATIFAKMAGRSVTPKSPVVDAETIVLFPGGLWRHDRSCALSSLYLSSYHDVPWDEPEFISACTSQEQSSAFSRYASRLLGY
jgi:hypothetical protein